MVQLLGLGRPLTKRLPDDCLGPSIAYLLHYPCSIKLSLRVIQFKQKACFGSRVSARQLPPFHSFCFHLPLLCRTSSCRSLPLPSKVPVRSNCTRKQVRCILGDPKLRKARFVQIEKQPKQVPGILLVLQYWLPQSTISLLQSHLTHRRVQGGRDVLC